MFAVDTTVLLHAVNEDSSRHEEARAVLDRWLAADERFAVTWSVVYEFLRVATHPAVFPHALRFDEAWGFVDALLGSGRVVVLVHTDEHTALVGATTKELSALSGNRFHDLHIAVLMREHGVRRIRTLDSDFHRLPWVKPEDPFQTT